MMEMPKYQMPRLARRRCSGCGSAPMIFLKRAGTIIARHRVRALWLLPPIRRSPAAAEAERIFDRRAHRLWARAVVKPIGFNHDIALALIPAMAAREVACRRSDGLCDRCRRRREGAKERLARICGALVAADRARLPDVVRVRAAMHLDDRGDRRETNGWKWPAFMLAICSPLALGWRNLLDGNRTRALAASRRNVAPRFTQAGAAGGMSDSGFPPDA
jgi:ferrous iron transport protein B